MLFCLCKSGYTVARKRYMNPLGHSVFLNKFSTKCDLIFIYLTIIDKYNWKLLISATF